MPKLLVPVPETQDSVTRPVIMDIVRHLFEWTGIPKDTQIFYPGDIDKAKQPGSSVGHGDNQNFTAFTNRVTVSVTEDYDPDRILAIAVTRREHMPVFNDRCLGVVIRPVYSNSDVMINFTFRAKDKVTAIRWRDDIRLRVGTMRDVRIDSITYHYLIPTELLEILKEIHRLRENVEPYGDTYDEYFYQNRANTFSWVSNFSGSNGAWAISETQMRVVGFFDFPEGVPEVGSKEDDGATWTINFSYKLKYEKPLACVMNYPLMIHNQVIKKEYRYYTEPVDTVEAHKRYRSLSLRYLEHFETKRLNAPYNAGVTVPIFDEFLPETILPNTMNVLTAMIAVDTNVGVPLIQYREMKHYKLDPDLLALMLAEADNITKHRYSVLNISLYRNDQLVAPTALFLDRRLELCSTIPLDLRSCYHVRLSVYSDLTDIHSTALERAREYGNALLKIMKYVYPNLEHYGKLPKLLSTKGNGYMSKDELHRALGFTKRLPRVDFSTDVKTVENLIIEAGRA